MRFSVLTTLALVSSAFAAPVSSAFAAPLLSARAVAHTGPAGYLESPYNGLAVDQGGVVYFKYHKASSGSNNDSAQTLSVDVGLQIKNDDGSHGIYQLADGISSESDTITATFTLPSYITSNDFSFITTEHQIYYGAGNVPAVPNYFVSAVADIRVN